jgi:formyl-CoA transferase
VQSPAGFGDHPTSMTLFAGILLALYRRQLTGEGSRVTTSLMANGVWSNSCNVQAALCGAEFIPRWTRKNAINPLINHYVTRDGHRIFFCLLDAPKDWPNLCRALGFPELIDDPRFSTTEARRENTAALIERIDASFAQCDLVHWARVLKEHDLIWGPVPPAAAVAHDPQCEQNHVFTEIHAGLRTIQSPVRVEGLEKRKPALAPDLGQHTREVLRDLGYADSEIAGMIERGAAMGA